MMDLFESFGSETFRLEMDALEAPTHLKEDIDYRIVQLQDAMADLIGDTALVAVSIGKKDFEDSLSLPAVREWNRAQQRVEGALTTFHESMGYLVKQEDGCPTARGCPSLEAPCRGSDQAGLCSGGLLRLEGPAALDPAQQTEETRGGIGRRWPVLRTTPRARVSHASHKVEIAVGPRP